MLNGLPVLTVCDVTLSVAGKGKLTTTTAGNAHTMPHQLDVGPTYSDCTMSKMPTTAIAQNVLPITERSGEMEKEKTWSYSLRKLRKFETSCQHKMHWPGRCREWVRGSPRVGLSND